MSDAVLIIAVCAVVTAVTRVGGYLVLSRFATIPPRVAAGLEAVPAAIMTTLVVPAAVDGGWREATALVLVLLVGHRLGITITLVLATLVVIGLRAI